MLQVQIENVLVTINKRCQTSFLIEEQNKSVRSFVRTIINMLTTNRMKVHDIQL